MNGIDQLLVDLVDALPDAAGDPATGVLVRATSVALDLPIEAQVAADGELRASLPRGRFESGFATPLGRMRATFDLEEKG